MERLDILYFLLGYLVESSVCSGNLQPAFPNPGAAQAQCLGAQGGMGVSSEPRPAWSAQEECGGSSYLSLDRAVSPAWHPSPHPLTLPSLPSASLLKGDFHRKPPGSVRMTTLQRRRAHQPARFLLPRTFNPDTRISPTCHALCSHVRSLRRSDVFYNRQHVII